MILQIGWTDGAYVRYDDDARKGAIPTPEVIEDILRRMERTASRLNAGILPDDAVPFEVGE